ncbi:MAG: hypothetical protein AMJ79_06920 [Phycisphaerae bacterium SM23_30]|nr:MAG: hypothetical protein AMJ79_06920 [Phycisphaerae bacterium SM23_30]
MKAIILAAGEGSRLGEISNGRPKCLIDIEDNTLLEIQINSLYACGIDDIVIVRGYEKNKINVPGVKYFDNDDYARTNMLHSLFCARQELTGPVLILYSDIIYEPQVVERIMASTHDIAAGVMVNWKEAIRQRSGAALEELEMVYFDSENRIRQVGKTQAAPYETQGQFIGIVKCSERGAQILRKNYDRIHNIYSGEPFGKAPVFEQAWLTDLFQEMTELGVPLHCVIIERGWMEIDTPADYQRALTDTQFVRRLIKVKTNWNHRAAVYNNLEWVNRDELLQTMVEMSGISKGQKVLDIGVGTGKVLLALKNHCPRAEYYGVDFSRAMLDRIDSVNGFQLLLREMEDLHGLADNKFDLITARMALHHAQNLDKAMSEIYRVLKPKGKIILCEGNPPDVYSVPFYKDMFRFKEDRITFLLDDLVNLLVKPGLQNITAKTVMLRDMSLNNWLDNSGLPFRNVDIIKKMHRQCDARIRNAYHMRFHRDDILMDWKFSVVSALKDGN